MAVGADPPDEREAQSEFACPVCNSDSVHQMEEFSRRLPNVPDPSDKRSFDQALGPTKRKALSWIKRNFPEGSTVLDIGCGRGDFLRALKGAGFHPAGVDQSQVNRYVLTSTLARQIYTLAHSGTNYATVCDKGFERAPHAQLS